MGFFSFIKEAGEKLFGHKEAEAAAAAASATDDEAAKAKYPGGWKAPKPYLRIVPQPKD